MNIKDSEKVGIAHAADDGSTTSLRPTSRSARTEARLVKIEIPKCGGELPSNIRLEWASVDEGHEGDLDFLLEFLYDEIRRRKRSRTFSGFSQAAKSSPEARTGEGRAIRYDRRPQLQTAGALLNTRVASTSSSRRYRHELETEQFSIYRTNLSSGKIALQLRSYLYLMNELKIFSSERHCGGDILSDNAKSFRKASQLIQGEMGHTTITWKFNTSLAPWLGGWWERLIKTTSSTKQGLRKSLGKKYRYITILREPVERFFSEWQHVHRGATWAGARLHCNGREATLEEVPFCFQGTDWTGVSFPEFVGCKSNLAFNRMTRMLSNLSKVNCYNRTGLDEGFVFRTMVESAKENLLDFAFFGILEEQAKSQFLFEHTLGIRFIKSLDQREDTHVAKLNMTKEMVDLVRRTNQQDIELYRFARELFHQRVVDMEKRLGYTVEEYFDVYRDAQNELDFVKLVSGWEGFFNEIEKVLLEDHIVKTMTMKGSPFIGPFEEEINQWDLMLHRMKAILDSWLRVQAAWLYLEPIFGSQDIRNQIPVEGKMFEEVDEHWRNIMLRSVENTKALIVVSQDAMLEKLQHSESMLDDIQKGLNNYLEKKRLFFPRFFFLSNDELLEILSETKDPLRVQPHLKKCFEGIECLTFTAQKVITAMESAEKERVEFARTIIPADAHGLVERWLQQVEEVMKLSLREVMGKAVNAYPSIEREQWVLQWPGQIVLAASQIHWTAEVTQVLLLLTEWTAIRYGGLRAYLARSNKQVEAIVAMVRGKLTKMARITLGALIVIDVHAETSKPDMFRIKDTSGKQCTSTIRRDSLESLTSLTSDQSEDHGQFSTQHMEAKICRSYKAAKIIQHNRNVPNR
ncbi:hypothetical protein EGW08_018296 [Elysia chlorotica]|uniref:Dynein heavy chain linker domain-containing protein n=1 Tax=Elysia chlorotica TaxID=188477 RepID=A0A433SX72_ELYCH|nr:hypothetical protein EGW08_018296 [Elysia chlorotica]